MLFRQRSPADGEVGCFAGQQCQVPGLACRRLSSKIMERELSRRTVHRVSNSSRRASAQHAPDHARQRARYDDRCGRASGSILFGASSGHTCNVFTLVGQPLEAHLAAGDGCDESNVATGRSGAPDSLGSLDAIPWRTQASNGATATCSSPTTSPTAVLSTPGHGRHQRPRHWGARVPHPCHRAQRLRGSILILGTGSKFGVMMTTGTAAKHVGTGCYGRSCLDVAEPLINLVGELGGVPCTSPTFVWCLGMVVGAKRGRELRTAACLESNLLMGVVAVWCAVLVQHHLHSVGGASATAGAPASGGCWCAVPRRRTAALLWYLCHPEDSGADDRRLPDDEECWRNPAPGHAPVLRQQVECQFTHFDHQRLLQEGCSKFFFYAH